VQKIVDFSAFNHNSNEMVVKSKKVK